MRKVIGTIVLLVVFFGVCGSAALALAAGSFPGAQSDQVMLDVKEPIRLQFRTSDGETNLTGFTMVPGEKVRFLYTLTNTSHLDYVVEIYPVFDAGSVIDWQVQVEGVENNKQEFSALSSGQAHLLLKAGSVRNVFLNLSLTRKAPAGFATSFVLNARRTECTTVPSCSWG